MRLNLWFTRLWSEIVDLILHKQSFPLGWRQLHYECINRLTKIKARGNLVMNDAQYAGFWIRLGANLIDGLLLMIVLVPLMFLIYGKDYFMSEDIVLGTADVLLNYIMPIVLIIWFWLRFQATPGKMATKLTIVDAKTGGPLSLGQAIIRYVAYIICTLPLFLGYIWIAIDKRKQGWHDKLANTVVIRNTVDEPVVFDEMRGE